MRLMIVLGMLCAILSIMVYALEGVENRYRIWSAAPETRTMEKG